MEEGWSYMQLNNNFVVMITSDLKNAR